VIALAVVAAAVADPRVPVRTFLLRPTPAKACAQLSPRYRKQLDRQYGPCTTAITANPRVTRIRMANVRASGRRATLDVHYLAGGRTFAERFTLVLLAGAWRIDNSGPL
jgi:hypothetical protein